MLNSKAITKKTILLVIFLAGFMSSSYLYGQSSIKDSPYFHTLVSKSMDMTTGKIDFVETKKIKGQKKSIATPYTLFFTKDVSYKSENKTVKFHLFNERDSILYIVNEKASYIIDYKKKEVITNERDELIYLLRKNHPLAYYYSHLAGGGLLLMGAFRSADSNDFSTKVSFTEQKIFSDIYTIKQSTDGYEEQKNNRLICRDDYEFRNKDTLLFNYTTKIAYPGSYEKGTTIEIETTLLFAILDNQEYRKDYYYDYTQYCSNSFQFYDKRNSLVKDREYDNINGSHLTGAKSLSDYISGDKQHNIYDSPDFLELETEMLSLFMRVRDEQHKLVAKHQENRETESNSLQTKTQHEDVVTHQTEESVQEIAVEATHAVLAENTAAEQKDTTPTLLEPKNENLNTDTIVSEINTEIFELEANMEEHIVKIIVVDTIHEQQKVVITKKTAFFGISGNKEDSVVIELPLNDTDVPASEEIIVETKTNDRESKDSIAILVENAVKTMAPVKLNEEIDVKNAYIEDVSVSLVIQQEPNQQEIFQEATAIESENITEIKDISLVEDVVVSIIPPTGTQPKAAEKENLPENIIMEDVIVNIIIPETPEEEPSESIPISTGTDSLSEYDTLLTEETNVLEATIETIQTAEAEQTKETEEETSIQDDIAYFIVLKYFNEQENADAFFVEGKKSYQNLLHLGMTPAGSYMVGTGPYKTEEEVKTILGNGTKGWILKQQLYMH